MLFRGSIPRAVDVKGRLMLPPEFRETLGLRSESGGFVLTTYDGCLVGYPLPDWAELEDKLALLRSTSRKVRDFKRLVIGGAEEMVADGQGRVLLSKAHLAYAGICREAVLVGQGRKFELWDKECFAAIIGQNFDDLADELADSGIDFPI